MHNITFDFKKEPVQKKSRTSYLLWGFLGLIALSVFAFSCGSDNPVSTEIPEHEHAITSPLTQLLNTTHPDILFGTIFANNDSSIAAFETSLEFRYTGTTNSLITVVRGVHLFYVKFTPEGTVTTDIGTAIGTIVGSDGLPETLLIPDRLYYYLVSWNIENGNESFPIIDPVNGGFASYTNFYVLTDEPVDSIDKRTGNSNRGIGKLIIK